MTFQQIRYFLVLAEELHFWKTSEKIFISQSSLSRQIQSLEEELDIQLFERDKRNVKLTEAGKFLQERWRTLLDEFERTHTQAKKIDRGNFKMISLAYPGSISSSFLPELLRNFTSEFPEIKINLEEPTDASNEKLLLDYHIDVAFSRDVFKHPQVESVLLYSEPVCIVVPTGHWLNSETFIEFQGLREENFILSGLHHNTFFASLLRTIFSTHGFLPKSHIETDFGGLILNLVAQGLGISILPYSFIFANHSSVRFIPLREKVDLLVNWRKNDDNPLVQNVVQHALALGKQIGERINKEY